MPNPRIIAVEEHYQIKEIRDTFTGLDSFLLPKWEEDLVDFGEYRLREMDAAGIDVQILSHLTPGTSRLDPTRAAALARRANDRLYEALQANPGRLLGYAELPMPAPDQAAAELERTVKEYGFKGAMVNGLTHGLFIDDERFIPVLEMANALKTPLYIHPSTPHQAVIDAYYKDYPALARAGWGFGLEAATHATRIIMSGLLDRFSDLRIILGHLGESLPFWLWRANRSLTRDGKLKRPFRDYFREHFFVTTSGNFSQAALLCSLLELGADKILFAVDWPFQSNLDGVAFVKGAAMSDDDKEKIFSRNAEKLFGI